MSRPTNELPWWATADEGGVQILLSENVFCPYWPRDTLDTLDVHVCAAKADDTMLLASAERIEIVFTPADVRGTDD
ncbi:hypothetical protein LCGC14_2453690 [marine sediment metagenome]|uniref:Uncharacterized protein n=1 Tax=marine sediment metagenome TaxID=412755 RepID=A0A0F9DSH0_9ZZZZ